MTSNSISEYLSSHQFLSDLSPDILDFLSECSIQQEVKRDRVLFYQGAKAENFYVIKNGLIKIQIPSLYGPALDIQVLGKDQVLGWSWLISPYKWNFQTEAHEDTELIRFDGLAILAKCEQEPKFGFDLMKKFAELMSIRLGAARQKVMDEWNPPGFS